MKFRTVGDPVKLRSRQRGYMDNQLPPVVIGLVLVVGAVSYLSGTPGAGAVAAAGVYLVVALGLAAIAWGVYLNKESLKHPESPFNKHTSPWLIAAVVIGGLGHAAWTARSGPHPELSYLLGISMVLAVLVLIFSARQRGGREKKRGLP